MSDAPASTEAMRDYWNDRARENALWYIKSDLDYAAPSSDEFWSSGQWVLDHTLGALGVALDHEDRVLEIGPGIGRITRAIAGRAASVVGVDVSDEMVRRGREALADVPNATLLTGNGVDLAGQPDAGFDAVYSFVTFQHIPDPEVTCGYIREMGRVLAPGGWAAFQVSQRAEIHEASHPWHRVGLGLRLRRLLGRAPRDTISPQWLGSAIETPRLQAAAAAGGLTVEALAGEGTQFCLVLLRKPGAHA